MSGAGTRTYKHPHILWGGRMRSSLKLPRGAKGCLNGNPVAYRTERNMPHHACSVLLLFMVK